MPDSKRCFKCEAVKPLAEFYRHFGMSDGHLNKCKLCTKGDVSRRRADNIEAVREYDRERSKSPARKAASVARTKEWRRQNKGRSAAHCAVSRAIRSGKLERQPCEACGNEKSVAHHDDYDRKLDVRWLCQPCHVAHHLSIKKQEGKKT